MRVAAVGNLPFDAAFEADDGFVLAWLITKGENDGGKFDWQTMKWLPRK